MLETTINDYGKDKLKNLARYNKLERYPIIYKWYDLHCVSPRKFIVYFAIPDDQGNTFIIPSKWCENISENEEQYKLHVELNSHALYQLSQVAKFTDDIIYPIIDIWEDKLIEENKKKFDIFFSILNIEQKLFTVQSTWGKVVIVDKNNTPVYI